MWVPVRSKFSRSNSTSSRRGSTCSLCSLPLTFTLIATSCSCSGIDVAQFNLFSARPLQRHFQGAFHQRRYQLPFVLGRTAHVGLRIGRRSRRLGRLFQCFWCDLVVAQN